MTGAGLTHTSAFPGPRRSEGDMVHVVLIIGTPPFSGSGSAGRPGARELRLVCAGHYGPRGDEVNRINGDFLRTCRAGPAGPPAVALGAVPARGRMYRWWPLSR